MLHALQPANQSSRWMHASGFVQPPSLACAAMAAIIFAFSSAASAAEFQNLDFELATITLPQVPEPFPLLDAAEAMPGWIVSGGQVLYNLVTLGSPVVILTGPGHPSYMVPPLQGNYMPGLLYAFGNPANILHISQVGSVPDDAYWMTFLFQSGSNFRVTLGGEEIPLFPVEGGRLAGNVSAFAGQEMELKFETFFVINEGAGLVFDDIKFIPTPEPGTGAFLLVGTMLLLHRPRPHRE